MKIKYFLSLLVLFCTMFLCGCDKEKAVILFNNQPINSQTVYAPVDFFEVGETTHFVIFNPKGFESPYLRLQIIKKETKTKNWGFKIYTSKNLKIDDTKNYYIDSFKLEKAGTYIVSVFYLSDLNRPIVRGIFTIK